MGRDLISQMLSHTHNIILSAEIAANGGTDEALRKLRELCLDDFGEFMLELPAANLPILSSVLPAMSNEGIQKNWTGKSGIALLQQTTGFIRSVSYNYHKLLGKNLTERTILDFGCGYGRHLRLMYYFSSPQRIWGVDPWEKSLKICRADNVLGNLAVSDYLPRSLPVGELKFDLIYAFSVFTHLSERATKLALITLRSYIADDGLLVITIRPSEYWKSIVRTLPDIDPDSLVKLHNAGAFVFIPHARGAVDGEVTYGDTSFSFDWLMRHIPNWEMVGYDHLLNDPLQLVAYLRPRPTDSKDRSRREKEFG
jgi:SAM-dependent methyltransferase